MGQTTHRQGVWCSKYFFFIISYTLLRRLVDEWFVLSAKRTSEPVFYIVDWRISILSHRPSIWCSKYYFFIISCKIIGKNPSNWFFISYNQVQASNPLFYFQSIKIILVLDTNLWQMWCCLLSIFISFAFGLLY